MHWPSPPGTHMSSRGRSGTELVHFISINASAFFTTQWTYSSYDAHNNRFPPFTSLVFMTETGWVLWETWTELFYRIYIQCNATAVPCHFSAGKSLASHHGGPGSIMGQSMRYVADKVALWLFFCSNYFRFPLSVPFHKCSIHIFTFIKIIEIWERTRNAMLLRTSGSIRETILVLVHCCIRDWDG
jgi:hypothetical protein